MNEKRLTSGVLELFSNFKNKLHATDGYFILVNSNIENWLEHLTDEIKELKEKKGKDFIKSRDSYFKKISGESGVVAGLILADSEARLKLEKDEFEQLKSGKTIFTLEDQVKNHKLETKILREFNHHSFLSIVCSIIEALLSDLVELFNKEYKYLYPQVNYNQTFPNSTDRMPKRMILEKYLNDYYFKVSVDVGLKDKISKLYKNRNDFTHSSGKSNKVNYKYYDEALKSAIEYVDLLKKFFEKKFVK